MTLHANRSQDTVQCHKASEMKIPTSAQSQVKGCVTWGGAHSLQDGMYSSSENKRAKLIPFAENNIGSRSDPLPTTAMEKEEGLDDGIPKS